MCLLGCSSASIEGILLKIRTSQCTRMRYEKAQVWLPVTNNKEYFIWRAKWLRCISASFGGIFLDIHTSKYRRIPYKQCKYLNHRLLIKSTLLGDEWAFSHTSRPLLEGLAWKLTPSTFYECATYTESFVSTDRKLRAHYMENQVTFRLQLGFHLREHPEIWQLAGYKHALQKI
jgi:hypothetical protein